MDANVFAIGPYSEQVTPYLPYNTSMYSKTKFGVDVVVPYVFECVCTSDSYKLAKCLGVDPLDFNTHKIKKENINWKNLKEFDDWGTEIAHCLLENGFSLMYLPNA